MDSEAYIYDDHHTWVVGRGKGGEMREIDAIVLERSDGRWEWIAGNQGSIEKKRSAAIKAAQRELGQSQDETTRPANA